MHVLSAPSDSLCLILALIRGYELVDILVFVLVSSEQARRSNLESTLVDQLRPWLDNSSTLNGRALHAAYTGIRS
jgi:hypothetical protein